MLSAATLLPDMWKIIDFLDEHKSNKCEAGNITIVGPQGHGKTNRGLIFMSEIYTKLLKL